jgi:hypothetical protein
VEVKPFDQPLRDTAAKFLYGVHSLMTPNFKKLYGTLLAGCRQTCSFAHCRHDPLVQRHGSLYIAGPWLLFKHVLPAHVEAGAVPRHVDPFTEWINRCTGRMYLRLNTTWVCQGPPADVICDRILFAPLAHVHSAARAEPCMRPVISAECVCVEVGMCVE